MSRRLWNVASLLVIGLLGGLSCDTEEPQPPGNSIPVLSVPTATPADVGPGGTVSLTATATDENNDPLTYAWTQTPASPAGTFSAASSASTTWTAPQVTTTTGFDLHVTVMDGKGGTATGTVTVTVRPNRSPTLSQGPQASPESVVGEAPVQLSVTAIDLDDDRLSYTWTQEPASPAGSFTSTSISNPTWTSPEVSTATSYTLTVTVSDGKGGTVQGDVQVEVSPPAPNNRHPTLTAPVSASATVINAQESVTLAVSAADPDNDPLTYTWDQFPASPSGTFSSTTVANPSWTAPQVTEDTNFNFIVTVSDGQGGLVSGSVTITVLRVNRPPTVSANITGPSTLAAGSTGTFSITATDPDGDTLSYSWEQTAPSTQGTFVGSTTGSSAQWFSPAIGTQTSFTLSVSVTDGQSTPVVRTITLPVSVPPYTSVQQVWNSVPCTGCHGGSGGLSLAAANSYANLVNVNANNSACNTLKRVLPGDPDNSALIRKMEGSTCGSRMPTNNPAYFTNNPGLVVRVRSWILAGAPNN